ncbi:MAG: hypothetical protein ABF608_12435 [Sporolactobacillus sp.]
MIRWLYLPYLRRAHFSAGTDTPAVPYTSVSIADTNRQPGRDGTNGLIPIGENDSGQSICPLKITVRSHP